VTPGPSDAAADARAASRAGLILLLGWVLLHVGLRLWISPVLTIDDAREAVLGQTLDWGYQRQQPPLYNWLVWAAFRLSGVSVLALTVVKYAVLAAAIAFVHRSARRLLGDGWLALLATAALVLVVPLSWTVHEALTHSVAALAACAATFDALLRLETSRRPGAYVVLGLAIGLGLLSKYSYVVFLIALLAAALTLPVYRARLLDPRALLALASAVAVVTPFVGWLVRHQVDLAETYVAQVPGAMPESYLGGLVSGLYYVARVALYYVAPLALVFLVLLPQVYRRRPADGAASGAGAPAGGRLLERFLLAVAGLLVLGVVAGIVGYLKFRWLIPGFFLLPLYFVWRLTAAPVDPRALRRLAGVLLLAEAAIVGGILLRIYGDRLFERPARLNEPYDVLAGRLADAGFTGGTIVVGPGAVAGSLRLRFPAARVLSLEHPQYRPAAHGSGQCLVVWERGGADEVPPALRAFLAEALDAPLTGNAPVAVLDAPHRHSDAPPQRLFYLLAPGRGGCR
jgi:4-amino-4-deoxy-L-arabinose transferase-like glycosyltransferase